MRGIGRPFSLHFRKHFCQLFCQLPATAQRAAPQRDSRRQTRQQFGAQTFCRRHRIFGRYIELTVTNARLDQRLGVADQMQDHFGNIIAANWPASRDRRRFH
jgi:hypothetical protein